MFFSSWSFCYLDGGHINLRRFGHVFNLFFVSFLALLIKYLCLHLARKSLDFFISGWSTFNPDRDSSQHLSGTTRIWTPLSCFTVSLLVREWEELNVYLLPSAGGGGDHPFLKGFSPCGCRNSEAKIFQKEDIYICILLLYVYYIHIYTYIIIYIYVYYTEHYPWLKVQQISSGLQQTSIVFVKALYIWARTLLFFFFC